MIAPLEVPRAVPAPAPAWSRDADVVVVGSGIAGLTAALELGEAGFDVILATKGELAAGSTRWAQGGIAAALAPGDSPAAHAADTVEAGGELCDPRAVDVLTQDGPERLEDLIRRGMRFDRAADGHISLTREGGHHVDRIAHAGGDATGAEAMRSLAVGVWRESGQGRIDVLEHTMLLDIVTGSTGGIGGDGRDSEMGPAGRSAAGPDGSVCRVEGVVVANADGIGRLNARAVILATGGIGQVFTFSTNPAQGTGDGLAAALRAGVQVSDVEFVQFHPTVFCPPDRGEGQQLLISEALRGEGAVLRDDDGERFMIGVHPMAELAPRDVVARAIVEKLAETGGRNVWLDARDLDPEMLGRRFPTIATELERHGLSLARDLIPVAPAQHYHCGGIVTDLDGRTTLPGLYAAGEVACSGINGANRLASNSLLEGLVFAHRAALAISRELTPASSPNGSRARNPRADASARDVSANTPAAAGWSDVSPSPADADLRAAIQRVASAGPGVTRTGPGLEAAAIELETLAAQAESASPSFAAWENQNLILVAAALTRAAALRDESRGGHLRTDRPSRDEAWRGHLVSQVASSGILETNYVPLPELEKASKS